MWLLWVFALDAASAYYIALDQTSAPYLRTWDGRPIDWSVGPIAALTDTSLALRVSSRGMHFYDHDVRPAAIGEPCTRSAVALCALRGGSLVFPELDPPRYSAINASRCGTESAGRAVIANTSIYDISVCDLFQGQLDVIYWRGNLHFDYNLYLPEWAYILTAGAVLYLVVSLGQNIARIMGDKQAVTMPILTEIVCVGILVLLGALHDPGRIFVAQHDFEMYCIVLGYIIAYLLRHAFELVMEKHVYTFNVITATLLLVTSRLYCSFETPYTTLFLFLLLTRLFHKLHAANKTPVEMFTIAADALLIALQYRFSFRPSFWDPQAAPVYATSIALACYAIGAYTVETNQ